MAWRIDDYVVCGEIDNRIRGRVTGRIWFEGRAEPVVLELAGDAWRDLAGRRLEFVNPAPKPGLPESFAARQEGPVGDLTASRKVRVPDIPLEEIGDYYRRREPFPWHWGNACYLEWFSARNGRVVIESASYTLTVSTDAAWVMSATEEEAQRRANGAALGGFVARLGEALEQSDAADPTGDATGEATGEAADDATGDATEASDGREAWEGDEGGTEQGEGGGAER